MIGFPLNMFFAIPKPIYVPLPHPPYSGGSGFGLGGLLLFIVLLVVVPAVAVFALRLILIIAFNLIRTLVQAVRWLISDGENRKYISFEWDWFS